MRDKIVFYSQKICFLSLLITLLLSPLFLFPNIVLDEHTVLAKKYFVTFSSIIFLFFFIFYLFFAKKINISKPVILVLIFSCLTVLSSFNSINVPFSLIECLLSLSTIFFFFFSYYLIQDFRSIQKIFFIFAFSASMISIIGFLQYFGFDVLQHTFKYVLTEDERRFKVLATLGNPDYLAGYLSPILLILIVTMLTVKKFAYMFFLLILNVVITLTVLFTESRANFVGLFIGVIIILVYFYRYRQQLPLFKTFTSKQVKYVSIFLFLFILTGSLIFISTHKSSIITRMKELLSFKIVGGHKERSIFYILANEMIFDHPFLGVGIGMYKIEYTNYIEMLSTDPSLQKSFDNILKSYPNTIAEHAHNDFLEVWAERGSLAFFIFLYILVLFFFQLYHITKDKSISSSKRFFSVGILASMICYFLHSMANFPLHSPERGVLFWVILSFGFRIGELNTENTKKFQRAQRKI